MKKILMAYLFFLLDLELAVNIGYFSLILPLLGASFLMLGFNEMANENEQFEQCISCAFCIVVLRIVVYLACLLSQVQLIGIYSVLLSFGVLVSFFAVTHRMLLVFREIEEENNLFMASRFCVITELCLSVIGTGCIWMNAKPTVGVDFMILSIAASVLFFLALYQLQVVYLRFVKTA